MHVVHLYDGHERVYGGRGSVPNVVWNVARETAAAGHDVTVVERRWKGLATRTSHEGVQFDRLDLSTGPDEPWTRVPYRQVTSARGLTGLIADRTNLARAAYGHLRATEYDVLHVHLPFAAAVLAAVAPGLRDRMVYTAHLGDLRLNSLRDDANGDATEAGCEHEDGGDDDGVGNGEGEDGDDLTVPGVLSVVSPDVYLASRAARTTVLNPDVARTFVGRGVPAERVDVVPNGVDVERFGGATPEAVASVRDRYGVHGPTLLFVGTVMPRKGVIDLVRAAATLVDERGYDDLTVAVAGDATLDESYTRTVRGLITDAGLGSHVTMLGFVPTDVLPALYAAADVFVAPSLEEGFGMTVVEAMAAGTPVVATRVGAIPRIVDPGTHGALADPGDVATLTDRLDALLAAPEARERMADAARERAAEYSWTAVADRFATVYAGVTDTRTATSAPEVHT